MHIAVEVAGPAIIALAIFAHAWQGRIQGDPRILSAIGWIVQVVAALAIGALFIDC